MLRGFAWHVRRVAELEQTIIADEGCNSSSAAIHTYQESLKSMVGQLSLSNWEFSNNSRHNLPANK